MAPRVERAASPLTSPDATYALLAGGHFEIVDDPWWFLDELWLLLISFPLIFEGFMGFRWFPWCRGAPGANCPAGVRFPCVLRGF